MDPSPSPRVDFAALLEKAAREGDLVGAAIALNQLRLRIPPRGIVIGAKLGLPRDR